MELRPAELPLPAGRTSRNVQRRGGVHTSGEEANSNLRQKLFSQSVFRKQYLSGPKTEFFFFVLLQFRVSPSAVGILAPTDLVLHEGRGTLLTCRASGGAPVPTKMAWTLDGDSIPELVL